MSLIPDTLTDEQKQRIIQCANENRDDPNFENHVFRLAVEFRCSPLNIFDVIIKERQRNGQL